MLSSDLFFISFIMYFVSFFFYILALSKERFDQRYGIRLSFLAFIIHTTGLIVRYYEAGIIELNTIIESTKKTLTDIDKLKIMLSHPPFTNFYESMIFVLWGIAIVYLLIERKYRFRMISLMGSGLVVVGMGLANLLPDKSITPLIPALRSWWLHLHVTTASLAYGAFLIAATSSLLFLLKAKVPLYKFVSYFLLSLTLIILLLVSFDPLNYNSTLMGLDENGRLRDASISVLLEGMEGHVNIPLKKGSPAIGAISLISIIISFLGASVLFIKRQYEKQISIIISATIFIYLLLLLFSTTGFIIATDKKELANIINYSLLINGITPDKITDMQINIMPPYKIGINSNPYQFTILTLFFLFSLFLLYISYRYETFIERLPDTSKIDLISYRTILFAFPMMTFVILTGAVWAHFAWGRYWGWDPKETWSLITWLIYAFYLHSRHVLRWGRQRSAIIAVIGFAVVIFTYIGVNLGLTGSGLHVYGSR